MNREPTNQYGYTKSEVREILERQRLERERSKYIEEQQDKARWNNLLDALSGTAIIRKVN